MVPFQWDDLCIIWICGLRVIEVWGFQLGFGHSVNHYQCSKFCPKLPNLQKFAQRRNFEIPPKIEILVFSKIIICTCREGTRACFHRLYFQSKNFIYVFFIVKKWPLHVNFSIPPCGKWFFLQCSAPLVGMRFWGYVPNSLRNKNMERLIPYLL
jgi:hypothetical protein